MRVLLTLGLLSTFLLGLWLGGFGLENSQSNVSKFHKYDLNQDGAVTNSDAI